uniref:F-BAR domain-containing protein n=1 Tax=Mastacembelus armatus TaxID=205130 RepID=A0A3Q3N232_9TELE
MSESCQGHEYGLNVTSMDSGQLVFVLRWAVCFLETFSVLSFCVCPYECVVIYLHVFFCVSVNVCVCVNEQHLQEGRKAQQYLDHCWKQMDNSKRKFERGCRGAEKSQVTYERLDNDINATKSEVEKAKAQFYLRTHMADESKNEYAAQLQNFNAEQWKHFNNAIPNIFKKLQDMDERRTVKIGETYRSFAEAERKVIPIISKCLEGMVSAAKAVDERRDSAIVVESFKSGFEPPGDFPFEDYSQNLNRTGSDATISNTPKGDRERDGAPGPRPDPKHAMSRTKNKLWLFGKKPKKTNLAQKSLFQLNSNIKVPSLEDFSHLPPEQRRKKLQQRIDELSKELQKEMDQRDALNKMKDVLQPKISETICNMEKLRSEIHKNETWLSEVEGKQSSRGDRRHSADNHHPHSSRQREVKIPEGSYTDDTSQEHHTPRHRTGPPQPGQPHHDPHEFDDEFDDDDRCLPPFKPSSFPVVFQVLYIIEEDKGDGWTRAREAERRGGIRPHLLHRYHLEKSSKGAVTYI